MCIRDSLYILLFLIFVNTLISFIRYVRFYKTLFDKLNIVESGTFTVSSILSEKDELSKLISKFYDVMDMVKKYDDVRASRIFILRKMLVLLLKNIKEPVAVLDHEKETFYINEELKRIAKADEDEFTWEMIINNPDNSDFRKFFENYIEKKNEIEKEIEFYFPKKDTMIKTVLKLVPVKDEDGDIKRTIFFFKGGEHAAKS